MDVARRQIEYYFSPKNLAKDTSLDQELKDNNNVCRYAWLCNCPMLQGRSLEEIKEACRAWSPSSCTDEGITVPSRGLKRPREYLEVVLSSPNNDEAPSGAYYCGDGFYVGFPQERTTSVFGRDKWKYLDSCPRWVKQAFKDEEIRKRQRRPSVLLDPITKETKAPKATGPQREAIAAATQKAVASDLRPAEVSAVEVEFASGAEIGHENTTLQERASAPAEKSAPRIVEPSYADEPPTVRTNTATGAQGANGLSDDTATVDTALKPQEEPPDADGDTRRTSQEQAAAAIPTGDKQPQADCGTHMTSQEQAAVAISTGDEQPQADCDSHRTSQEQAVVAIPVGEKQPEADCNTHITSQDQAAAEKTIAFPMREEQPRPDCDSHRTSQEQAAAEKKVLSEQPAVGSLDIAFQTAGPDRPKVAFSADADTDSIRDVAGKEFTQRHYLCVGGSSEMDTGIEETLKQSDASLEDAPKQDNGDVEEPLRQVFMDVEVPKQGDASLEEPPRRVSMDVEVPKQGDASLEEPPRRVSMDVEVPKQGDGGAEIEYLEAPKESDTEVVSVEPIDETLNHFASFQLREKVPKEGDTEVATAEPIDESLKQRDELVAPVQFIEDAPKEGDWAISTESIEEQRDQVVAPVQPKEDDISATSVEPIAQQRDEEVAPVQLIENALKEDDTSAISVEPIAKQRD